MYSVGTHLRVVFEWFFCPFFADDDQPTKSHKSRRKPTALLKKKAVTTSFIEMSSKFENGKALYFPLSF